MRLGWKVKMERQRKKNEGGGDEDELEKNKPVPMYFTHPKQLLDVFAKLEEENLTLIARRRISKINSSEIRRKEQRN